ncbi:hypothetical protein LJC43_02735 [Parabacteroides sp. OttesenSCG-928-G21]|nr:hypothetical protein [Parabacteroides sp. OttesenSCG-928-G21]
MLKISRVVIISILIATQWPVCAQNNTNSPYTRFGYGELANRSFGAGRSMGGVGYGLRSSKQINPLNPASYTGMDSLTFLFDFGVNAQLSWYDDGVNKQKDTNGNIEYMAMQFPISKRMAVSIGILPYSYVGYKYGADISDGDAPYREQYIGTGGLNDIYAGLSIDIWKKRLSVGANVGYLFGNVNHNSRMNFESNTGRLIYTTKEVKVKDLKLDFGLQYTHPLSATQHFVVGLAYSPSNRLNAKSTEIVQIGTGLSADIDTTTITGQRFDIPNSFGLGFSYVKANKLTVAADILYETWGEAHFFGDKGDFKDRIRIAAGLEYLPNYQERAFFKRVRYRAGLHYSNSYLKINSVEENGKTGFGYDEYGASVGFGLPLVDNRSFINIGIEYVKIKPESKLMIDEQYLRFTLNYTFNERWFFKFKVD